MANQQVYDIKDAARYLGVAPSTLRYWESRGLVSAGRNRANDYRQYTVHDLIDASETAFYRMLGVSVKELEGYRSLSVGELDEAMGRTEQEIEQRIATLQATQERLAHQRSLNARMCELERCGMRPGVPTFEHLAPIDYDAPVLWKLLANEPWHYGLLIEVDDPQVVHEVVADMPLEPGERGALLWQREEGVTERTCREALLCADVETGESNAAELFAEAERQGLRPQVLVASYLVTAADATNRWDYHQAWVLGEVG